MIATRFRRLRLLPAALVAAPAIALAQPPAAPTTEPPVVQGPTFKSGVDLIRLDVTVVEKDGYDKVTPERLYFSDLLIGQDVEDRFQPRLQFAADAGMISALVELYGEPQSGMDRATVEFDVRGLDGATRAATRITPAKAEGEFRSVAIAQLPVARLRPGSYELHAKVLVDGRAVGLVRRQLTITAGAMARSQ